MAQLPISIHACHIPPTHTSHSHSSDHTVELEAFPHTNPLALQKLHISQQDSPPRGSISLSQVAVLPNMPSPHSIYFNNFLHHHHLPTLQHHLRLQNKAPMITNSNIKRFAPTPHKLHEQTCARILPT